MNGIFFFLLRSMKDAAFVVIVVELGALGHGGGANSQKNRTCRMSVL
jgi:hypothetical protein